MDENNGNATASESLSWCCQLNGGCGRKKVQNDTACADVTDFGDLKGQGVCVVWCHKSKRGRNFLPFTFVEKKQLFLFSFL